MSLEEKHKIAIGLVSDGELGRGVFKRGTTSAFFHSAEKAPVWKDEFMSVAKCGEILGVDNLNISAEMPSTPTLDVEHEARALPTSPGVTEESSKMSRPSGIGVLQVASISEFANGVDTLQIKAK